MPGSGKRMKIGGYGEYCILQCRYSVSIRTIPFIRDANIKSFLKKCWRGDQVFYYLTAFKDEKLDQRVAIIMIPSIAYHAGVLPPSYSGQPLAQDYAIGNCRQETAQIDERRDSVQLAKLLVELSHLLGVRRRVVTLLAVDRFCRKSTRSAYTYTVYSCVLGSSKTG